MRKIYTKTLAAAIACCTLLTGCNDGAESRTPITLPTTTTTAPKPETTPATTTEATTTATTTTAPITIETEAIVSGAGIEEDYGIYTLSDEDEEYISRLVFVGDSICRGYNVYGLIPDEHSLAHGNVAARSIMDYTFDVNGRELNYLGAIYEKQPEYIVFSMGMNDVNMTTKEVFCDNYRKILEDSSKYCPNSLLIVLGITPICSEFSTNNEIDIYNAALAEMIENSKNENWCFANAESELKNANNELKSLYSGGDGIHLSPDAYKAVLWYLCRNRVEFEFGDEKLPSAPGGYIKPGETTAPAETVAPETTKKPQTSKPKPEVTVAPETTTEAPQTIPDSLEAVEATPEEVPEETAEQTSTDTAAETAPEEIAPIETSFIELPIE